MPRQAKPAGRSIPEQTLVVDNGAFTIKAGWATSTPDSQRDCLVIPNCMARGRDKRVWIAGQIEDCRDFGEMSFRRPVEKGYLVNWEAEKEIWDKSFMEKNARLKVAFSDGRRIYADESSSVIRMTRTYSCVKPPTPRRCCSPTATR